MISVEKSLLGTFYDVLFNGRLLERFDRKYQAENAARVYRLKLGGLV